MSAAPAKRPCVSCPYRRDVPSGVWAENEYAKLPAYDVEDTGSQPMAAFFCHQQDGRLCAGWVGCHDMTNNLGLRMAALFGHITPADQLAALTYETDVELFESGAEAAEHGIEWIAAPDEDARRIVGNLERKQSRAEGRSDL